MFFHPMKGDHGLPFDPFKAIVAPRPIGWISSLDAKGRPNLAPYSFFNAISSRPHIVMFSSTGEKDRVGNIEATGDFVCNLATWDLREAMNQTSAALPHGVNEFTVAGLDMEPSRTVKAPRVAGAVSALECQYLKSDRVKDVRGEWSGAIVVYGEVTGIHIDDRYIRDGRFVMSDARTIARCGYRDYAVVDGLFEMSRPTGGKEG